MSGVFNQIHYLGCCMNRLVTKKESTIAPTILDSTVIVQFYINTHHYFSSAFI